MDMSICPTRKYKLQTKMNFFIITCSRVFFLLRNLSDVMENKTRKKNCGKCVNKWKSRLENGLWINQNSNALLNTSAFCVAVCCVCVKCVLDYKWIDIQWTVRENLKFSKVNYISVKMICIFRMYHFTLHFFSILL